MPPAIKAIAKRDSPGQKKLKAALEAGKKGDYRLAAEILRNLISETDAPPEAWLLLGRALHVLGDYSRALAAFNDYIKLRPGSGEGYLFAGRTYMTVGMPYKAVPLLRKAVQKKSGSSITKALLGIAYLRSKHSQAAVQTLQEAVEAAPENKRIYRAYLNSLLVRGIRLCGIDDYELGLQMLRFVLVNGKEAGMPDNPFLRLYLGRAARETGNLEESLEHFTVALKLSKNDGNKNGDRRIRWSRASILMSLGKTGEATKEIEKIRSQDAEVPELPWNSELVDLFMIRSFMQNGEWRQAAASCRNWLKSHDTKQTAQGKGALRSKEASQSKEALHSKAMIHALYAEALRNLRNYKIAHNHIRRALDAEPNELEFLYADILVSWEGRDYTSLKKALKAAKNLGGDPAIINRFEILCRLRTSDDELGNITLLQNATRSFGPEPEFMYALGEAYLKVGLLEEARNWFKKTILIKSDHERAWLGEIAAQEAILSTEPVSGGKTAEKLRSLYEEYLEKWPGNSNIRRERALFLIKTCDYAEAALELEKLLVWEPSNPSLRRVLAYAYRKTGRYRDAAVFLRLLLKEKPRDIGLLIEYSGCLGRAGAASHALTLLEKARETFQNASEKTTTNRRLENSKLEISGGYQLSDLSLALGIFNFRRKNIEKAFDYLREAAVMASKDPRPYEWMAIIAKKNGDYGDGSYYEREAEKRKKK